MKYKRKLAPATTFDFAAMETWLSDMAEDGWIPVDFRGEKVKFQQAEPQKRSYRIAIPRYFDTQPTAKQLEAYRQLGWEFICTYRCKGYLLANIRSIPKSLTQTLPYRRKTLRSFIKRNAIFILQAWFSALCFSSA